MRSNLPHRKDANHNDLAQVFTDLGCSVLDLSMVGNDCPDILVGIVTFNVLVEIKSGKGKLSEGQERFRRDWNGPVEVCRDGNDVVDVVTKYRRLLRKLG